MRRYSLFGILVLLVSFKAFAGPFYQSFDWDNNVVNMPTRLIMFHKQTNEGLLVSTEAFAILRDAKERSKYGLSDYELRESSFENFSDDPTGQNNHFFNDLKAVSIEGSSEKWKGPRWKEFVEALSDADSAERVSIITARKQSPERILEGLAHLKSLGMIKHLPHIHNVWAVGNPDFPRRMNDFFGVKIHVGGEDHNASTTNKAIVITAFLDKVSASYSINMLDKPMWSFSDDDYKNIIAAVEIIKSGRREGKWRNLQIQIEYTGPGSGITYPHLIEFKDTSEAEEKFLLINSEGTVRRHQSDEKIDRVSIMKASDKEYKINTSNKLKLQEFSRYLGKVVSLSNDLMEPDSDPITIVRFKASQFEDVLIDDTSLEIEGEDVGANVKWKLPELGKFAGKSAVFRCLLAIRLGEEVKIYRGEVEGTIVEPRGRNYGFLPFFLPNGATKTLAEDLPDHFNSRFYAVKKFLSDESFIVAKPLFHWDGKFQAN